jgi:phosphoribosylanthranilate isomerase
MTRAEDACAAAALGAAYVGVIFAGGPRRLTVESAAAVLHDVPKSVRRVGVFADASDDVIAESARRLGLGVVQLHTDCDAAAVTRIRAAFEGEIWGVLRLATARIPDIAAELFATADAVLIDARVPGKLGGTGVTLPWRELAEQLSRLRATREKRVGAKLVLAGGLNAENVKEAIRLLRPEIVDVSSGVETAPGIKDHARMRAFRDAVHAST